MVSVFSNTIVTRSPSGIRRRFFMAMMPRAELVALAFVGAVVDDVVDGELPHGVTPLVLRDRRRNTRTTPGTAPRGRGREPNGCVSVEGLEALGEAAGVALLGPGERLEPLRDLLEALVASGLGEARVHLGVLVGLALDRRLEVVGGGTDRDAGDRVADLGQEVEVAERVPGLTFGDRAEQRGDVRVALDVGLLREVEVPAVRLALARERLLEVVVGLAFR